MHDLIYEHYHRFLRRATSLECLMKDGAPRIGDFFYAWKDGKLKPFELTPKFTAAQLERGIQEGTIFYYAGSFQRFHFDDRGLKLWLADKELIRTRDEETEKAPSLQAE